MSRTNDASSPADRVVEKLVRLASSLDAEERALFAALLSPGVSAAAAAATADDEATSGCGQGGRMSALARQQRLRQELAHALSLVRGANDEPGDTTTTV